ncbi:N-acetylneuraminate synthase family protein, partial [Candidatus Pelagibacter sp.]|nr:N-acetylneuraminate synthase family protein [Candidatus Pelagibacter sp.]
MILKIKNPILVAEISANHNGSIIRAKKLIDTAKKYGADAVKLQTYEPSSMTINKKKNYLKIRKGIWKGKTLWDLYKMAQTPFHWQKELFQYAKKKNILCFSTPFDFEGVDLLESINCPIYKIASFEITDIPLIRYVAQTKKPIIISTGMSSLKEIDVAYKTAISNGSSSVTILYCVSNYPSKTEDFNLKNIITLKERYKCRIGFSDHSTNNSIGSAAAALG